MAPTNLQRSVSVDLLFTGFVHGRCVLAVETSAQKLLEEITNLNLNSYNPLRDSERFLDCIDDLRELYIEHLAHIFKLLPKEDAEEYREAARRIEAVFDECRKKLLTLNSEKMAASKRKTVDEFKDVAKFNGKVGEWAKFQVEFKKRVLENGDLCEAKMLKVFNMKVSSEIRSKLPACASIEELWKALRVRFEQAAIRYHVEELFAKRNVSERMTSRELVAIIENSEIHILALQYLGYETNALSSLLLGHLLKSQTSNAFQNDLDKVDRQQTWYSIKSILLKTATTRRLETTHKGISTDAVCYYCKNDHILRFCKKFRRLPFEKRLEVVVHRTRICHICFSNRHLGKTCDTMVSCSICRGSHNTVLHPDDDDERKIALLDELLN